MGKAKSKAASLNPETFTEGGGLIDDVDVSFKDCLFEMFDYQGKVAVPIPALKATMVTEDGDEMDQFWSMGSANDWIPSEDGSQIVAVGSATGIRSSSNGGIFLKSLIDAGFPVDKLGDDITVLDGMQAHVIQVPAPKRAGIKKAKRADGKEYEDTILIIGEIKTMPWEKSKPKGAPKGKAAGKGKAKPKAKSAEEAHAQDEDLEAKATAAILEILEEAGTVSKKELPGKIFQTMKADPDRNAVVKLVFSDEFLGSGPWDYDDGVLVSA